jgi:hypothetical protein
MTEINPGDVRRVSGSFTNPAGMATDPTTISVRWRHHRGTETTWVYGTDTQVVRDSAGVFHADIPITVSGLYYYKFEGTGAVQAAEEGTFLAETFFESVAPSTPSGPIRLYTGTTDPTTGAGVPAAIGSVYSRTLLGSESVWVKTGAADTAWTQAGTAGGGGITNTAPAGSVAVSDGTNLTGSANLTWDNAGNILGLAAAENGGGTIEAIGVGGQLFLRAHDGDATHVGGEVQIRTGHSDGQSSGQLTIETGNDTGGGDSGGIGITTGFATGGASGDINIRVDPNDGSAVGGNILIQAGTGQIGSGGDIYISAGSALSAGSNGSVQILDGTGSSIEMNPSGRFDTVVGTLNTDASSSDASAAQVKTDVHNYSSGDAEVSARATVSGAGLATAALRAFGDGTGTNVIGVVLKADASGHHLFLQGLTTSDPGVAGEVWNDAGTLKVSAG